MSFEFLELSIPKVDLGDAFDDLSDGFKDLTGEFKDKVKEGTSALTRLWRGAGSIVGDALKPVIEAVFNKFKELLKEASATVNQLLGKSKALAEDLLKRLFEKLSNLVADINQRVTNLLNQLVAGASRLIDKAKTDLLEPFIEEANKFINNLIDDLKELINKIKEEANEILYKTDKLFTGTFAGLTNELVKVYADVDGWDIRALINRDERRELQRHEDCKRVNNISGGELKLLGNGKLYDYLECKDITRLHYEFEESGRDVTVKSIKTTYADLQDRAWKLACLGRNSNLQDKALEGFVKYGQLYQLWDQFEDDMTAYTVMEQQIQQLDSKIKRLNETIETFQAKSAQLDNLSTEVQVAQAAANTAQGTANQAVSNVNSLQSAIQNGSIIAQKAVMLQARDENHWMRWNHTDPRTNEDAFMLFVLNGEWHPLTRVHAAHTVDKLWFSDEFVLDVPNNNQLVERKLLSADKCFAFITGITGKFEGGGERVWLEIRGDRHWWLCGKSSQPQIQVKARCAGLP